MQSLRAAVIGFWAGAMLAATTFDAVGDAGRIDAYGVYFWTIALGIGGATVGSLLYRD